MTRWMMWRAKCVRPYWVGGADVGEELAVRVEEHDVLARDVAAQVESESKT